MAEMLACGLNWNWALAVKECNEYSLHPIKFDPGAQKCFQLKKILEITSKDMMIFIKIKGNLGK